MTTGHLSETEIQLYATELEAVSNELRLHVQDCANCQAKAANYILLFQSIQETQKHEFDFDLSALVMEQLPQTRSSAESWITYVIISTVVLVSLCLLYLIIPYLSAIGAIISPMLTYLMILCTVGISIFLFSGMYQSYQEKDKIINLTSPLQQ